jgi:hypothetical protein
MFGEYGGSYVASVSCAAVGACAAGGSYTDSSTSRGFVADERNGTWGRAQQVPGLSALSVSGGAFVVSVSCGAAGDCAAVGDYGGTDGKTQAFVADETNGIWGMAIPVPGLGSLDAGGSAQVQSVSCATAGNCAAGGSYVDASKAGQGFVVDEAGGVWGTAHVVPGLGALSVGGHADVTAISCTAAGACAAGGVYNDAAGDTQGFVADESIGTWGTAQEIPSLGALNVGHYAGVASLSCAAPGECTAGGWYDTDTKFHAQGFVADESNGTWGAAQRIPGGQQSSGVQAVSCGAAGSCAAAGGYVKGGFVVNESGGMWGTAEGVSAPIGAGSISAISCASARHCAAVGDYATKGGLVESFVISEPGAPRHCSPSSGLTAAVTSHQRSDDTVFYRIVYTNRGASSCQLAGIPGAMGYATMRHAPVGPSAKRTGRRGRGGAVYLTKLGGQAETTFAIHLALAKSKSCRPEPIDGIIIRPMGTPQLLVSLHHPSQICRRSRNEAIYGFGPASQSLT